MSSLPPNAAQIALQKISMAYSQVDDRILLIVITSQGDHRYWMTRRFVRIMWEPLLKNLENFPGVKKHLDEQIRKTVLAMRHQEALVKSDFSTEPLKREHLRPVAEPPPPSLPSPPEAPPEQPAPSPEPSTEAGADEIHLLIGVSGGLTGNGVMRLSFQQQNGKFFQLHLDEKLLHAFCHLLIEVTSKAEWSLDLRLGVEEAVFSPGGTAPH